MKRVPILLLLLMLSPLPAAFPETDAASGVLDWVNDLRARQGEGELAWEPLLERTAASYAGELRRRGVLSHVDEEGRRALQRFHASGGTTVLVGEILGSGENLRQVAAAWEQSPRHREVVANPHWTHCGAARVRTGTAEIWVVLFTSRRIDPLEILSTPEGYTVHGRIAAPEGREPVLLSGIDPLVPLNWDPESREFTFFIPLDRQAIYHRLGYRSAGGILVVTDTFYPVSAGSPPAGSHPVQKGNSDETHAVE
jgi:hypothetical protein